MTEWRYFSIHYYPYDYMGVCGQLYTVAAFIQEESPNYALNSRLGDPGTCLTLWRKEKPLVPTAN
jgi:hypothetical protein